MRLKPREMVIFCALHEKLQRALCMILARRFTFIVERSWKKIFSPKNGLTPCYLWHHITYHSNWPSIKLSQNVRKGWTNSYWKRRLLMFYPLGKKLRKTLGEGGSQRKLLDFEILKFSVIAFWGLKRTLSSTNLKMAFISYLRWDFLARTMLMLWMNNDR